MKEERIKKLILKFTAALAKTGKVRGEHLDKEGIHDFRVTVKKLRAFLRMLAVANGQNNDLTKDFKRIYHIAGAIRDMQLELEKARKLHIAVPGYTSHLEQVISQQRVAWDQSNPEESVAHLEKRLERGDYSGISSDAFYHFLYGKTKAVRRITSRPQVSDDQLHEVRKHIKDAVYATELCRKKWREAYEKAGEPESEELKKITDKIGDYNDQRIMMAHMDSFADKLQDSPEKTEIRKVTATMAKNLKSEKKETLSALQAYLETTTAAMHH